MASVYQINKGINQSVMFKGLKAQYIWYLGGGIVALLVLFAVLYICGVNMFVCLGIVLVAGVGLFSWIYGMSNRYGEHGLIKKIGNRQLPRLIRARSRKLFMKGGREAGIIV